jgi:hypothetical protein
VEYLGHVISQSGVATDPDKVAAIANWEAPTSVTQLRSFLGLTGYYRRFIKGYGQICRPLYDILKKDAFHWTEAQTIAFSQLKQSMTTAPVLALPDFTAPFVLECDASGSAIGAVIMQNKKPIAFYSKALGVRAAALSTYEKEAIAILEAVKKWRHYLLGTKLIIKTDHQSLKFMNDQRVTTGIQQKLLLKLLEFDYAIEYKKGQENRVADALSRKDTLMAISIVQPSWTEDIELSYAQDTLCQDLIAHATAGTALPSNYTFQSGILRYKGRIVVGSDNVLKNKLLDTFHSSPLGGHSGIRASYQRIKRIFQWPNMKKDVETFIQQCPTCQRAKTEHCHYPGLLVPLPIPDMAWSHISMDFVEGLPKSNGKEVILVVVDRLTKYSHFIPLAHPFTVNTVVQAFLDNVFKLHGLPLSIVTDRDRIFTSKFWQQIFKTLKVNLRMSTAYHPQSDGQTERVNQCLESYLRSMAFSEPKKWCSWLSLAEWWYNSTYHTATKFTPFHALYGFPAPMISEISISGPVELDAKAFLVKKEQMLQQLKANLLHAQQRMKKYADAKRTERQFNVGDMVYIKLQPYRMAAFGVKHGLKLATKYYGPYRVLKRVGPVAYQLLLPTGTQIHNVFHVSQLKKHLGPKAIPVPDLPLVDAQGNIKVQPVLVLETRAVPRHPVLVTQWLVQWLNLSPEEATWEDANFIQTTFPEFYAATIRSWFPPKDPRGQGSSSEGGSCQDPVNAQLSLWVEEDNVDDSYAHWLTEERKDG